MNRLKKNLLFFVKNNKLFVVILSAGLLLRIYKFSSFFQFGHEQDLQAWIVKDILIDYHPRLIGQETSITGLFIGPLYYYLLVPFFFLFNMDPRASIISITLISLATLGSVYWILTELFRKQVGIIGAILYAVSPAIVFLDRWVVPTQPTLLWIAWFYFCLIQFARGKFQATPILIILIGLIWHVHIAFVPLLLLIPVAVFLRKKDIKKGFANLDKRYLAISLATCFLLLTPLIAFEFRHNFQQAKGLLGVNDFSLGQAMELREGYYKVEVITEYINRVVWSPFLYQQNPKNPMIAKIPVLLFVYLGLIYFLYQKKKLPKNETVLIFVWLGIVFVSQMLNKRIISDYYFNNLLILSVILFSLFIYHLYSNNNFQKWVLLGGLAFVVFGTNSVVNKKIPSKEFEDRVNVVEFIAGEAKKNDYPCVAINYIGDIPIRYGYRYLFWWKGVGQIVPGNDVPVYSLVQPHTISESEIAYRSGDIGVVLPQPPYVSQESACTDPNRQLLPLNGFVN